MTHHSMGAGLQSCTYVPESCTQLSVCHSIPAGEIATFTLRWACSLVRGTHLYTQDLIQLERSSNRSNQDRKHELSHPPLPPERWEVYLRHHLDSVFADFIRRGLRAGFRIGAVSPTCQSRPPSRRNHRSAYENSEEVTRYIQTEVSAGRLQPPPPEAITHASPIGIIPKSSQPGKWRMITDLSSPRGSSVNDSIDPSLCSLKYAAIDQAIRLIRLVGKGAVLAKMDLKSAYRMVPIHPSDQPLLAVTWQGTTHVDTALPFGLRSAPKIFSAVADTLVWAMVCNGLSGALHYLDDFLGVATSQQAAETSLSIALRTCQELEFPVATEKTEGPATSLVFLGIQFDTRTGSLELPQRKVDQLHCLLREWEGKRAPIKRDLLSLLGHLSHAASVIRPGRTFVRLLVDAAS